MLPALQGAVASGVAELDRRAVAAEHVPWLPPCGSTPSATRVVMWGFAPEALEKVAGGNGTCAGGAAELSRGLVINHAALNRGLMPLPSGRSLSCWYAKTIW